MNKRQELEMEAKMEVSQDDYCECQHPRYSHSLNIDYCNACRCKKFALVEPGERIRDLDPMRLCECHHTKGHHDAAGCVGDNHRCTCVEFSQLLDAPKPRPKTGSIGYHINMIPKGTIGESSKILEEVFELQDAELQNASVMGLMELCDIIGAVDAYRKKHFPDVKLDDLVKMANVTRRAFESGQRK